MKDYTRQTPEEILREKLELLEKQLAISSDPGKIFDLEKNIEHLKRQLGGGDATPTPATPAVSIARLPVPGPHFLGRQAELERLDKAFADDETSVFVLTAFGGVGKSALVYKWLEALRKDHWRGAERVLGWSFYSQGTDATAANADAFVDFTLGWLGHKGEKPGSPWERGVLLARLVRQRRTLLVLDGLEPLQHPPGSQTGRVKDPAVAALLRELAMKNNGLCVVTTRLAVADVLEAEEIAERGHMRLHECDAHLEATRIALVRGEVETARERLAAARRIVEETGYRRREPEVELLEEWLAPS